MNNCFEVLFIYNKIKPVSINHYVHQILWESSLIISSIIMGMAVYIVLELYTLYIIYMHRINVPKRKHLALLS